LCEEGLDLLTPAPFKGNVDLEKLEELLKGPESNKISICINDNY
jgi:tryptophanase